MEITVSIVLSLCFSSAVFANPRTFGLLFQNYPEPRLQQCRSTVKPCKILVKKTVPTTNSVQIISSPDICDCLHGSCPSTWDASPEKTITRYLRSQDQQLILQLKFCSDVSPERLCNSDEIALTFKGHSLVPSEIVNFRCRCPGVNPMVIKAAWNQGYNERYQEYVCSLPTCDNTDSQCMSISNQPSRFRETSYNCRCSSGYECTIDSSRRHYVKLIKGFCSPSNL